MGVASRSRGPRQLAIRDRGWLPRDAAEPGACPPGDGRPFFIVGADRSGTTMLRLILNRHPELAIPAESHFVLPLLRALPVGCTLSRSQVDEAIRIIATHPRFATWNTSANELASEFSRQAEPTLKSLVDAAFRREISASGKRRWGDKTPVYANAIEDLARLFPEAVFIHIIRDGRDVSLSLRNCMWHGWTEYQRAGYWARTVRKAELAGRRLGPDRYTAVRYQDLVLAPERTIRELCGFLGIDFADSMASFHEDAFDHVADFEQRLGIHDKLRRQPRATDVERWRRESSWSRVLLFEAIAGRAMDQLGIARRFEGVWRYLGAVASILYFPLAGAAAGMQHLFEALPPSIQSQWRNNAFLRTVKQTVSQL